VSEPIAAAADANASAADMTLGAPVFEFGFGLEVFCELVSDMKCIRKK
jgi:hypothetical protein